MNAERAKRREEIAARMMAALNGPMGPGEGYSDYGAMARDAVRMANALMDELDVAALADTTDADPVIWQKDWQIADLEEQLAELKQRAEGGGDRDIVIEANAIQIAALNGIVKVREDQIAELERKLDSSVKRRNELMDYGRDKDEKLDTMTRFVELVRAEAHEDPELYSPFVRLVRDLDAKVGAK